MDFAEMEVNELCQQKLVAELVKTRDHVLLSHPIYIRFHQNHPTGAKPEQLSGAKPS